MVQGDLKKKSQTAKKMCRKKKLHGGNVILFMYIHVIYVHFCTFASIFSIDIKTLQKCWRKSERRQWKWTLQRKSSVFHHCFSGTLTRGGCCSQSQLSLGEGAASSWTSQQFIKGPHKRQTTVCTHTHSCLEFPVGLVSMSVDIWEDAGGANMQTLCRGVTLRTNCTTVLCFVIYTNIQRNGFHYFILFLETSGNFLGFLFQEKQTNKLLPISSWDYIKYSKYVHNHRITRK